MVLGLGLEFVLQLMRVIRPSYMIQLIPNSNSRDQYINLEEYFELSDSYRPSHYYIFASAVDSSSASSR